MERLSIGRDYDWSKSPNPDRCEHVCNVMSTVKRFSEDGGASAGAMESFGPDDINVLHMLIDSWIIARPGVGGTYLGYEAVLVDGRVAIVSPTGQLYKFVR
jgi:hypothetical protein